jgi:hypothetical protein
MCAALRFDRKTWSVGSAAIASVKAAIASSGRPALSAALPRAFGQRLGQIGGLDIAIFWMLNGPNHPVRIAQRPDLFDLFGSQEIHIYPNGPGDACIILIFIHPIAGGGEANIGHL